MTFIVVLAMHGIPPNNYPQHEVVTPMMTRGGEHSEADIPMAIARARSRHPSVRFQYAWPFAPAEVAGFLAMQIHRCLE
jgi:CbiX protein